MINHRNPQHRDRCIKWAKNVMSNKDKYLILDTETTGLNRNDVVVQIALITLDGEVIVNEFIKPTKRKRISNEAVAIHGISMKSLDGKPHFRDLAATLKQHMAGKTILIYNADYDTRLIEQTCDQDEIYDFRFQSQCVMLNYSEFYGEWNEYYREYKWQKLKGGDHSALGDCLATLELVKQMAQSELSIPEPIVAAKPFQNKKWWQFWK